MALWKCMSLFLRTVDVHVELAKRDEIRSQIPPNVSASLKPFSPFEAQTGARHTIPPESNSDCLRAPVSPFHAQHNLSSGGIWVMPSATISDKAQMVATGLDPEA